MKRVFAAALCLILAGTWTDFGLASAQQALTAEAKQLDLTEGLSVGGTGRFGRRAINTDAVQAMIVEGTLGTVKEGDRLPLPASRGSGEREWKAVRAGDHGEFSGEGSGWIACTIQSDRDRVMMLEARGHAMVYVNGEPRMGDPYSAGFVRLPIELKSGKNVLLFASAGRGGVRAKLVEPRGDLEIFESDLTTPDVITGRRAMYDFGVPVMNATAHDRNVRLIARRAGHDTTGESEQKWFRLPPCTVLKVPVSAAIEAEADSTEIRVSLEAQDAEHVGVTAARREIVLKAVDARSQHKITRISAIDNSVQYFSVVPPAPDRADEAPEGRPALVLSLHGASVEATGQAASYKPKTGMVIVCPTNRRPYGFDWEDWGRIDAIEAMDRAIADFRTDPCRQYLTGHSMGGHGTWQLGVLYPQRFAAIAPSAGWLSFDSYGNARPDSPKPEAGTMAEMFARARASSDTEAMLANLEHHGIYILHGDKDDNVPVEQARRAKELLENLHIPFKYHEQPGAGHWWGDEHSGAACMDWPAIFEMFSNRMCDPAAPAPKIEPPIDERGFPRGSFKRVFDHNFVLVYGTIGDPDENSWALAKARFDAEQWWYRGNGRAPLMSDVEFVQGVQRPYVPERNVVLYGNARTNRAWGLVAEQAPLSVDRGVFSMADRRDEGQDFGVLCAWDAGDFTAAMIGGTGIKGMRALDRIPYFTSGVGVPEVTILRSDVWSIGTDAVVGAGMPDLQGTLHMAWHAEPSTR